MKKNIKVIIGIIVGMVIGAASGIGVYATLTYSAGDIAYTKSGSSTPISVSSALNELYQNKKETTDDVKNITANGNLTLDKYYKNVNVNVPIPAGYIQPSGTKTITTKANNIDVSNYQYVDTTGMYTSSEVQSGKGKNWDSDSFISKSGENIISLKFLPKKLFIYKSTGGSLIYDYSISSSNYFYATTLAGQEVIIESVDPNRTGFGFRSIGTDTNIWIKSAGETYYWVAIK